MSLKSNKDNMYQYIFMVISRSVLLRMRNVSNNNGRENQNKHFRFYNYFFRKIVPCIT